MSSAIMTVLFTIHIIRHAFKPLLRTTLYLKLILITEGSSLISCNQLFLMYLDTLYIIMTILSLISD